MKKRPLSSAAAYYNCAIHEIKHLYAHLHALAAQLNLIINTDIPATIGQMEKNLATMQKRRTPKRKRKSTRPK